MKRYSQRGMYNAVADINVIPLMDLVFNLLIIFMLATPLLEQSINLQLPTAHGHPADAKDVTTVNIDSAGRVFLGELQVGVKDLEKKLQPRLRSDPDHAVLVRGDKGVSYGKFVEVVDQLKLAGVRKLGIVGLSGEPPPRAAAPRPR